MDAALFSGETNIPVTALGIIHDNPSSDAAMYTAYLALNADAESAHRSFGAAWVETMKLAWRIYNEDAPLPAPLMGLKARFRDPSTPTRSAAADSATKLVAAGVLPAGSGVTLDMVGLSPDEQAQVKADLEAETGDGLAPLAGVLSQQAAEANEGSDVGPQQV